MSTTVAPNNGRGGKGVSMVPPANTSVPPEWWNASARIEAKDEMYRCARQDPFSVAKEVRRKRAVSPLPSSDLDSHERVHSIVRNVALDWNKPSTDVKSKPPLSKWQSMRSMTSMNPHAGFRPEPKKSLRFDCDALDRSGHITLEGYLTVCCPDAYHSVLGSHKMSILIKNELKAVEFIFDFENHLLTLTRRGKDPGDVRRRHWRLCRIIECNDYKGIKDHLESAGVVTDIVDLERIPFCGLYLKSEALPLLLVSPDADLMENLVVVTQHVVSYFKSRLLEHMEDVKTHGEDAPISLFRDFTLRDITNSEAKKTKSFKDGSQLKTWKRGVGQCILILGGSISKSVLTKLDDSEACICFRLGDGGNDVERTPHPDLTAAGGSNAVDAAVSELIRKKDSKSLQQPETFKAEHGVNWAKSQLSLDVERNAVVLRSPKWTAPVIVVLPTRKRAEEFVLLIEALNRTHNLVSDACREDFLSAHALGADDSSSEGSEGGLM